MVISRSLDEFDRSISGARFYVILLSNFYYRQEIKVMVQRLWLSKTTNKDGCYRGFKTVSTALAVCQLKLQNVCFYNLSYLCASCNNSKNILGVVWKECINVHYVIYTIGGEMSFIAPPSLWTSGDLRWLCKMSSITAPPPVKTWLEAERMLISVINNHWPLTE